MLECWVDGLCDAAHFSINRKTHFTQRGVGAGRVSVLFGLFRSP